MNLQFNVENTFEIYIGTNRHGKTIRNTFLHNLYGYGNLKYRILSKDLFYKKIYFLVLYCDCKKIYKYDKIENIPMYDFNCECGKELIKYDDSDNDNSIGYNIQKIKKIQKWIREKLKKTN